MDLANPDIIRLQERGRQWGASIQNFWNTADTTISHPLESYQVILNRAHKLCEFTNLVAESLSVNDDVSLGYCKAFLVWISNVQRYYTIPVEHEHLFGVLILAAKLIKQLKPDIAYARGTDMLDAEKAEAYIRMAFPDRNAVLHYEHQLLYHTDLAIEFARSRALAIRSRHVRNQ